MLKKFQPDYVVRHFNDVNIEKLKTLNKKLVICDIDNTLVAHDEADVSDKAEAFLRALNAARLEVILVSNNTEDRVQRFNEPLNFKAYPMALKPLAKTYNQIFKDYPHIKKSEMIALGDQVMTDVWGAKRQNIDVILTEPIVQKDLIFTKINRHIENVVMKLLKKRGLWPNEKM